MPRATMEQGLEFFHLHQQGLSYGTIGKSLGFNNKTVSAWVKKAQEHTRTQRDRVTATDLNTRYTGEHHQMLLGAARGIHRAVCVTPPSSGQGQTAAVLLEYHILMGLQDLDELLISRGVHVRPGEPGGTRDGDLDLLETMAGRLREGLSQHLPQLSAAVQMWSSSWDDLRVRLIRVTEEVAGTLVQSRRGVGDAAHRTAVSAVEIALAGDNGHRTDGTQSDPGLDFAVLQVELRMGPPREGFGSVSKSAAVCREMIADLLLMGGPPGRCSSCPLGTGTPSGNRNR